MGRRIVRRIAQIVAAGKRNLQKVVEAQKRRAAVKTFLAHLQPAAQPARQPVRHRVVDLQPRRAGEAPGLDLVVHDLDDAARLVQLVDLVGLDDPFVLADCAAGHAEEVHLLRRLRKSRSRLAAITCSSGTYPEPPGSSTQRGRLSGTLMRTNRARAAPSSGTRTARFTAPAGDERERVLGIDCQRRQDRLHVLDEVAACRTLLRGVEMIVVQKRHACLGQRGPKHLLHQATQKRHLPGQLRQASESSSSGRRPSSEVLREPPAILR